ncbi:hypothetical protein JNUCC42_04145 [Brevibacterium sp. JNUCC-42]|nr:hypothetical protein JNUCC42_04145 [Brevibacterium sp. JNUCC-42]
MKFYNIDQLNDMNVVFFETSKQEHFEIKKLEEGYLLSDITPPKLDMNIAGYCTFQIPKLTIKEMLDAYKWDKSADEVDHFFGLVKGGRFGFYYDDPNEMLLTKGRIEKAYVKMNIGVMTLNIHMFDWSGKKIATNSLGSSFIIRTDTSNHHVTILDGVTYFEGREVLSVCSIIKQMDDVGLFFNKDFDVSTNTIYLNRPFIILTRDGEQTKLSIINEMVRSVEPVGK